MTIRDAAFNLRGCGRCVYAALAIMLGAGAAFPQSAGFEGKKILAIEYEPPKQPLAPVDLQRVQLLRPGAPLSRAEVSETIDRMFATARYGDIQVDVQNRDDGVVVRFITRFARFVGHVSSQEKISSPPNRAEIVNAAQFEPGTLFRAEALSTAEKNIQQLFANNGLYEAQVHLDTIDDPEHQQTDIRITINPGKRARYTTPVIRGDTKLPDSVIVKATGWRVRFIGRWRSVTQALTKTGVADIEKKYHSQDRLAATVDLKSLDYDPETIRAKATLDINAGPKIKVTALEAKVSKRLLKRYVPVYEEGSVDRDLLVEGARNLRDYFQAKGYPDVDVTFRQPPPTNDEQSIEYLISRGPRRKLVHVEILGNKYFDRDTLRERMFLEPSSLRFRWGRFSQAFRKRDEETITNLYKANGFRDVKVTSVIENNYQGKPNRIGVTFTIREGPQWVVDHLTVSGVTQLNKDEVLSRIASGEGQPYSDLSVSADRSAVTSLYYSNGFRRASFEWSATPSETPNHVNLEYKVKEGNQEFVRDVLINGLAATRRSFVERNLNVIPGGPISMSRIRDSQRRLYDLGVFAKIDTAIQNNAGDESEKYVMFNFDEAHRYNMRVGVGAEIARIGGTTGDLNQPAGAAGFSPRVSLEISRLNMFGLGHTATLQTRVSNLEQRVSLSYVDPKLFNDPARTLTFTTLYSVLRDVRTFSSRREEASVQFSQKLTKADTLLFRFAYRRVSTMDVVIPALLVPLLLQPVRLGILSANWVQDKRDNPADSHTGIYNSVDTAVTSKIFGSQRQFTKILGRNATYYRINRDWVLARQLTFGAILPFGVPAGTAPPDFVPLPERFFAGGSVSHRGFPENQAGPRDIGTPAGPGGTATQPTGFPLGGNAVLISNIELRFPLLGENIGGVLFHDAGNVYRSIGDISFRFHQKNDQDFNYMVHAAGFGIRYKTPVGPVRVDLAYSINPPRFVGFKGTTQELLQCNPNVPADQLPAACRGVSQSISHFQFFFSIGQTF